MLRGPTASSSEALAAAAAKPGMGKTLGKAALGIGALVALVIGLGEYAHPKRPNTTPDNEYGLTPTNACDMYSEPIVRDFRGVLWNKSTYTRVDLSNPPPLHTCSQQELVDAGYSYAGGAPGAAGGTTGAAPVQKRNLQTKTLVSARSNDEVQVNNGASLAHLTPPSGI